MNRTIKPAGPNSGCQVRTIVGWLKKPSSKILSAFLLLGWQAVIYSLLFEKRKADSFLMGIQFRVSINQQGIIMSTENFSQFCLIGGQYAREQGHLFTDHDGSIWFVFNFMGYTRDILISK